MAGQGPGQGGSPQPSGGLWPSSPQPGAGTWPTSQNPSPPPSLGMGAGSQQSAYSPPPLNAGGYLQRTTPQRGGSWAQEQQERQRAFNHFAPYGRDGLGNALPAPRNATVDRSPLAMINEGGQPIWAEYGKPLPRAYSTESGSGAGKYYNPAGGAGAQGLNPTYFPTGGQFSQGLFGFRPMNPT